MYGISQAQSSDVRNRSIGKSGVYNVTWFPSCSRLMGREARTAWMYLSVPSETYETVQRASVRTSCPSTACGLGARAARAARVRGLRMHVSGLHDARHLRLIPNVCIPPQPQPVDCLHHLGAWKLKHEFVSTSRSPGLCCAAPEP